MNEKNEFQESWLLCRAGSHLCALPLTLLAEVMRLPPVEPLAEAPPFMSGIAVIRGAPVAVLDLGRLLGQARTAPTRLVTAQIGDQAGGRVLGIAVAEVIGVRRAGQLGPRTAVPLLREAAQESVSAIGALDSEALLFLGNLHLLVEGMAA